MERLGPDTLAIFWSAPTRVYSGDVDYEYPAGEQPLLPDRDRSAGHDSPADAGQHHPARGAVHPRGRRPARALGRPQPDGRGSHGAERHRDGHDDGPFRRRSSPRCSRRRPMGGEPGRVPTSSSPRSTDGPRQALAAARTADQPDRCPGTGPAVWRETQGTVLRLRRAGCHADPLGPPADQDAYEQAIMRKSVAISNEAHKAGMREAAPGKFEYEVEAAIEHVYLRSGAMSWGYPSIVGSGPNATILHYNRSSRRMERGDLLLVDAAGKLRRLHGRHHPHLPCQRNVRARSTRDLRDRARGPGGGHRGGESGQAVLRHSGGVRRGAARGTRCGWAS